LVLIELAVLVAVDVVGVAVVAVGVVGPGTGVPGLVVRRGRAVAGRLVVGRVRTVAPAAVAGRDTRRLAGGVEDDLHRLRRLVDMRPPRRLPLRPPAEPPAHRRRRPRRSGTPVRPVAWHPRPRPGR